MTKHDQRAVLVRSEILTHTSFVKLLPPSEEDALIELIQLAVDRFLDGWSEYYSTESESLTRALEHIDRVLASVLVKSWSFHDDDDFWAFRTEDEAFAWLQGEGPNAECKEPDGHFDRSNNWKIRSLWDVRSDIVAEIGDLMSWDKARWKLHWTRPPSTTSQLPTDLQEMIYDFCQVWHDHIDPSLGLPRRDPNPSNPLIRFIDSCLKAPLGDQRPAPKTVLQLVHDHIRPAIREYDEARVQAAEARHPMEPEALGDVDSDPFSET
ncbi:hypothetical protein [Mesorhizobium caraganae]|uniref:hypothetical protein n=1 Tax=Mesorhizobium caraganae TaxID=483206 RepID=UPI003ED09D9F